MTFATKYPIVIRWQIGPFGEMSWRALNLSIRLMQRIEPNADLFVVHQGDVRIGTPGVNYFLQDNLYSHGRFERPYAEYLGPARHEMTLENDHIMWELPPAWERWKSRSDATLAWIVDWDYYGNYAERVGGFRACPGMYGTPPGVVMPPPPIEERGDDQAEQGWVASWLREHPPHEIVTHDEVSAYMPNHDILRHTHSHLGTHGVHLPGLNRGWSRGAEKLIEELERKYL
jgi:hypothetical protein